MLNDNTITRQVKEFIEYKHSLGFKIKTESQELLRFARYTRTIDYDGSLTADIAIKWASSGNKTSQFYKARRLEIIHTFSVYALAIDPDTQIPPKGIFGKCHGRTQPYIYDELQVQELMQETNHLYSPDGIRAYTVKTGIGLLYSSGIRVSELISLQCGDFDWNQKLMLIRCSKFRKDRIVPLDQSVIQELMKYDRFIYQKCGKRSETDDFFLNTNGKKFNIHSFEYAFNQIRNKVIIEQEKSPRLYDFRHTFACRKILEWLRKEEDVNQKMYLLSVYMGHEKPEDTYWYLSATSELLSLSSNKYERSFGNVVMPNAF